MRKQSHRGFTLIELLVVLAVITIVSSISFGAFKSISQGNKRTSCQSNLGQIYKSVRLYAQDFEGRLPYLNENGDPGMDGYDDIRATPKGGIGLWSLYTFGKPGFQRPSSVVPGDSTNCPLIPNADPKLRYELSVDLPAQLEDPSNVAGGYVGLSGYVRSAKIFHCPSDNYERNVQYRDLTDITAPGTFDCKQVTVNSPTLLIEDGDYSYLNPSYLSYQTMDDLPDKETGEPTYSSFRRPEDNIKYRQITPYKVEPRTATGDTLTVDRAIKDMTVLTWCRFHRSLDPDGSTRVGKRQFDNVLFSDGSVQSLPAEQDVRTSTGVEGACSGWQRVPRDKTETMISVSTNPVEYPTDPPCIPSP